MVTRMSSRLLLLALLCVGCTRHAPAPSIPPDGGAGAREMAKVLKEAAVTMDTGDLPFVVDLREAEAFAQELKDTPVVSERAQPRLGYATELLNAGKTQEALAQLELLEKEQKGANPTVWAEFKDKVAVLRVIGYLRMGEQENCCAANTPDSCLLPIKGAGIHTKVAGSTKAMVLLTAMLQEHPDDLQAKWLLNIAAMTLGKYPAGVDPRWRIDPKVFASDYPLAPFPNVAAKVGLDVFTLSGGLIADDLDGDGNLDIFVSSIGFNDELHFYHNNADGTFTDKSAELGLAGETGGLNLFQADYDNDGRPDILVLRGAWMGKNAQFPLSLLHNDGNGHFSDVTVKAGLLRVGPTQAAVWLDYDNDGLLDLFVGYESSPDAERPCALFHNNGNGTFTEVAQKAGVAAVGFVKAAISADYDNDGFADLFLTRGGRVGGHPLLFHNNHNGTFTEVSEKAGIVLPEHSFSTFFFDYDNDGFVDLFVVGYSMTGVPGVAADYLGLPTPAERSRLYHNNGNGTFTDVSHAQHLDKVILGMGINFGDLDNDGWLDFYVGTGNPNLEMIIPNRMFRNDKGKGFQEVTTSGNFGHLQKGHSIAFADLNNDGHQDIFAQMGGANLGDVAHSALFANPTHPAHWLNLTLEGTQTNRGAVGARVKVTVQTPRGPRVLHRTVGSGGSFGAATLRQEIGLGDATTIEKVEVFWPVSQKTQVLTGLALDHFYRVREDSNTATALTPKTFAWPR